MAIYKDTKYSNNTSDLYKKMREERGVKKLYQMRTKIFDKVDIASLDLIKYIWKKDDNLFKLANRFYSNKNYWWLIAYVNNKPTDAHFEIGEEILVPNPDLYGRL